MDKKLMEYLEEDFFTNNKNGSGNDVVELLDFLRLHSTPLDNSHIEATFLLRTMSLDGVVDFSDLINHVLTMKQFTASKKDYFKMIDKLTLADRIRGNAKLSTILKQPTTSMNIDTREMQMKGDNRIGY